MRRAKTWSHRSLHLTTCFLFSTTTMGALPVALPPKRHSTPISSMDVNCCECISLEHFPHILQVDGGLDALPVPSAPLPVDPSARYVGLPTFAGFGPQVAYAGAVRSADTCTGRLVAVYYHVYWRLRGLRAAGGVRRCGAISRHVHGEVGGCVLPCVLAPSGASGRRWRTQVRCDQQTRARGGWWLCITMCISAFAGFGPQVAYAGAVRSADTGTGRLVAVYYHVY